MTSFRIPVTITDVFERKVQKHQSGYGDNTVFTTDSAGWYLKFGDHLAICVGTERPDVNPGDLFDMVLKPRSPNARPNR